MTAENAPVGRRAVALLIVAFLLSGFSGLVYEVLWLRMLIRVFGISVYAVSTVLTVFMAGLAAGGFVGGRLFRRVARPLRWYVAIEVAVALLALAGTAATAWLPQIFAAGTAWLGDGAGALFVLRALLALVVLFPPTFLMGATLPLLSGYVTARGMQTGRGVGMLYGMNTLGAVIGAAVAGFLLLELLGEWGTCLVAAALNAAAAVLVAVGFRDAAPIEPAPEEASVPAEGATSLMWLYGISGFCALAYQLIWSRLLILVLGNFVYGFSSMLAVYLLGIAAGSMTMAARWVDRLKRPLLWFAAFEAAIAILGVLSLVTFVALGSAETRREYLYTALWTASDLPGIPLRAFLIVFPSTFVMGALFPLVARLCVGGAGSTARTVGRIYGWNTVGAIAGSFLTGFFLIPVIGTRWSFLLVATASLALAVYGLVLSHRREAPVKRLGAVVGVGACVFLAACSFVAEDPFLQVFRGRLEPTDQVVRHVEDTAATVTVVHSRRSGYRKLHINGLNVSGNTYGGRLLMHLPSLLHPDPQSTLIVGLGAGQAFRASLDQGCETTVIELVGAVKEAFPLFEPEGSDPTRYTADPKAKIVVDDARNYLLRSDTRVDLVLVDGSPPIFASGTVNLYSLEFVRLVEEHLTEEGIFALWLPSLFESDLWMITRNFCEVFPHCQLMLLKASMGGFVLGTRAERSPFLATEEELRARATAHAWPLFSPENAAVVIEGLVISEDEVRRRASAYPPVTDDRPHTEFPLFRLLRGEELVLYPRTLIVDDE